MKSQLIQIFSVILVILIIVVLSSNNNIYESFTKDSGNKNKSISKKLLSKPNMNVGKYYNEFIITAPTEKQSPLLAQSGGGSIQGSNIHPWEVWPPPPWGPFKPWPPQLSDEYWGPWGETPPEFPPPPPPPPPFIGPPNQPKDWRPIPGPLHGPPAPLPPPPPPENLLEAFLRIIFPPEFLRPPQTPEELEIEEEQEKTERKEERAAWQFLQDMQEAEMRMESDMEFERARPN